MKIQIKNRYNGRVIYESEAETLRSALEEAARQRANLRGADLRGANLSGANLSDAYLRDAYLRGANLGGADFGDADLHGAYLGGANLRGADLRGANLSEPGELTVSWSSHALLSEILWRAAGDNEPRLLLAAYVGCRTDWCWDQWSEWEHPEKVWALRALAQWVKPGDDAPEIVRAALGEVQQ